MLWAACGISAALLPPPPPPQCVLGDMLLWWIVVQLPLITTKYLVFSQDAIGPCSIPWIAGVV